MPTAWVEIAAACECRVAPPEPQREADVREQRVGYRGRRRQMRRRDRPGSPDASTTADAHAPATVACLELLRQVAEDHVHGPRAAACARAASERGAADSRLASLRQLDAAATCATAAPAHPRVPRRRRGDARSSASAVPRVRVRRRHLARADSPCRQGDRASRRRRRSSRSDRRALRSPAGCRRHTRRSFRCTTASRTICSNSPR